jgi:hypothetical protein
MEVDYSWANAIGKSLDNIIDIYKELIYIIESKGELKIKYDGAYHVHVHCLNKETFSSSSSLLTALRKASGRKPDETKGD